MDGARSIQYRADIDGLRGIAVLPVILFHAGVQNVGGGFIGVDIFFVISGYVISRSLLSDIARDRFSILAFYDRRIRRILPALTTILMATYVGAIFLAPPSYFAPFARSLSYTAVFLSNVFFWRNSDYFLSESQFQPLLHTWSLAIEEQFYLVMPIALYLVTRLPKRSWALALSPILLASLTLSVYAMAADPRASFFSPFTRIWELGAGVLLALSPPQGVRSRTYRELLSVLAVALIASPIILYSESTPFPGLAAIPPCVATAMLIHLGASTTPPVVSKLLAWRPLVFTGLISYSLYLIHWPLIVLARFFLMRNLEPTEIVLIVIATFVLAGTLYYLIEMPLRRRPAPRILVFGLAFTAIVVTAVAGRRGHGLNRRLHEAAVGTQFSAESMDEINRSWRTGPCLLTGDLDLKAWQKNACVRSQGGGDIILLWGDSFAAHYTPGLATPSIHGTVVQYTAQGCPPVLEYRPAHQSPCAAFNRNAIAIIEQEHIRHVVLAANWSEYPTSNIAQIGTTLEALRIRDVKTTVIGQSPAFFMDAILVAARRGYADALDAYAPLAIDAAGLNAMLRARVHGAGARFVDPMPHLCPHSQCAVRLAGQNLFFDYGHFTIAGSSRAVRAYFPYVSMHSQN